MIPRKPPAFADWLLCFFGLARKDQPLAGDLLEEFQAGRSAAWYWRQTLLAIAAAMGRNARNSRRHLTGGIIGWAVQACIAFALWQLHFPPKIPHGRPSSLPLFLAAMVLVFALPAASAFCGRELKRRSSDPKGPFMSACGQFVFSLSLYCLYTMLASWDFVYLQASLLLPWVISDLIPDVLFARLKNSGIPRSSPPRNPPDPL